ncbi:transcriptional regulator [Amycolatopsis antarctica]|uniref:Transcriptional regulator n=1 Tax=Amycolatopsis antarctica TaxID=1854586 RepID=A0A263D1H7_9PSEU|nr:helix-turn-helix transcriptional regulator [Amycolatopsis antarctica]OZM72049.1 transcriptional regulator [Amycolatopsis antarctica]
MGSPVVAKIQLGRLMRRLRTESDLTREDAARTIDCDISKISRVEAGKGSLRTPEVDLLIALYQRDDLREQAVAMARDARRRTSYRVPDWARDFVGMEADSKEIRTYEAELVPGLLQTPAYTRAVTMAANPQRDADEVDRLVGARAERQARLTGDNPPHLFAVVNEAVVRRVVGGRKTMQDQLGRLLDLAELPTVSLHVLPFTAGAHAGMGTSFVLLALEEPAGVRFVYLEDIASADYLDEEMHVRGYSLVFDRLLGAALGNVETIDLIEQARQDM